MKRIFLVSTLLASLFVVQLGSGVASANAQITPTAQSVSGVVGSAITATTAYTATGISGTKVFIISPSLPGGLSINTETGVVSGTPTEASVAANYTVTVSVNGNAAATATITIAVSGTATLSPGTQTVTGRVGAPITATTALTSTGLGTRFFSIAPALPAGLTFNSTTGVLSGTASEAKTATTYVVTAADGTNYAVATMRVTIAAVPVMTPATQSISGLIGTAIAATAAFAAPTVTGTKTFSVSPALPAGLSLNTATGVVSGTPTAVAAQATHVVTATDGTNFATSSLSVVVNSTTAPTTTVPSTSQGCVAPTIGGRLASTIEVASASLPLSQFACSMRIGVRPAKAVVVAIAHQGTTVNRAVARYSVVLTRVNGGSITRPLTMATTPGVLRANYQRLISGTWSVTVVALSADGTAVGTYTSATFRVG